MTDEKIYKVTFAGRMDPALKDELVEEARENGMTPSAYVESLLTERKEYDAGKLLERIGKLEEELASVKSQQLFYATDPFEEEDELEDMEEEEETDDDADEQIQALQSENEELDAQISDLVKQNEELEEKLAAVSTQKFHFSPEEEAELEVYLQSLASIYDMTPEQLVLASLYATALNEKAFLTNYVPSDYARTDRDRRISRFVNDKSE